MSRWAILSAIFMLGYSCLAIKPASAVDFAEHPAAAELVSVLSTEFGLNEARVEAVVRDAVYTDSIIKAITRPAEKFPWYRYRPIFVTDANAEKGIDFWNQHRDTLQRAELRYGVDASIIVAIIGVETRFGTITGRHRVIDSLVTLVLGYPRRKDFFLKELAEYIQLAEEEKLDLFQVRGSYAGAMGIPQFISSSYRRYAVDFNDNQQRDLLTETADAIGSVANYLSEHGWSAGEDVYAVLVPKGSAGVDLTATEGLKADRRFSEISEHVDVLGQKESVAPDTKMGVVELEIEEDNFVYRAAYSNFYVITTYNRSTLYAMAVAELAELISSKRSNN